MTRAGNAHARRLHDRRYLQRRAAQLRRRAGRRHGETRKNPPGLIHFGVGRQASTTPGKKIESAGGS